MNGTFKIQFGSHLDEGEGGDTFHMSRYHLSHVSEVQCNSTLQYSAVQHCSRLVHQKIQKSYLKKKSSCGELKFCNKHWRQKKLLRRKIVILCVNFDQFTEILAFEKVIKKWKEKKINHLIINVMSSLAKRNATTFNQKLYWPQEVKVLGWRKHTDTQTNTQTWRIVDGIQPEGQFGENNCLGVSFP